MHMLNNDGFSIFPVIVCTVAIVSLLRGVWSLMEPLNYNGAFAKLFLFITAELNHTSLS